VNSYNNGVNNINQYIYKDTPSSNVNISYNNNNIYNNNNNNNVSQIQQPYNNYSKYYIIELLIFILY